MITCFHRLVCTVAVCGPVAFCHLRPLRGAPLPSPSKALSVGSRGSSWLLPSPHPRRTKGDLLFASHCLFLQWFQTAAELTLHLSEEPCPLSWGPISQPLTAASKVSAWALQPSCHDPAFSLLMLLSFWRPRCGALADLLQTRMLTTAQGRWPRRRTRILLRW